MQQNDGLQGEGAVVSGLGWLVIPGLCLGGVAFWRAAHLESTARRQALIDQTLEYERMAREPRT